MKRGVRVSTRMPFFFGRYGQGGSGIDNKLARSIRLNFSLGPLERELTTYNKNQARIQIYFPMRTMNYHGFGSKALKARNLLGVVY